MDAKDLLRRYLEQRREMGESELVLDRMSVDEAMALLGGSRESGVGSRGNRERAVHDDSSASVRDLNEPQIGVDWRAALRASGAAPETMPKKTSTSKPMQREPEEPRLLAESPEYRAPGTECRLDSLGDIATAVATCTRCSLHSTALNPVPGEGNPNADFMCVGEAPGATEDETGRPFIGAAGQLLTKILGAIGLAREDVFICNVLKHRPPGNRNPLPNEVEACSPYLIRQIELVKPKVILALGTFASQTLLNTKTPIGKLRGQVHRYHGVPLVVTYHPAALLRNPSWKRPTWEDVQLAHRILTGVADSKSGA